MCDFGWAAFVNNCNRRTYCGTTDYLSPELLNEEKYGKEVDIWSIGVLAYELVCGKAPFASKRDHETRDKIIKMKFSVPEGLTSNLKDFIEGILKENPEERPNIDGILNHPWIKSNVAQYRQNKQKANQNLTYFQ